MTRAALYCRVSTDAQAERYGLGSQEQGLRRRTVERNWSLVQDGERNAFIDDGYSGSELDRPALSRLRQAITEGRVDVVLCYDPDRLSRSLSHLLLLTSEFEGAEVRLEFITQDTDTSPEGRMFFAIRGAVAEYEKAKILERTARGRREKARQGKIINPVNLPWWLAYDKEKDEVLLD